MKEEAKPKPAPEPVKVEPKRRGRPPKKAVAVQDIPVLPKRRGRPPKKLVEDEEESPPVAKKRRGRPPKKKPAIAARASASQETPVRSNVGKKRRGRPPKNKNLQNTSAASTSARGAAAAANPAAARSGYAGMPRVTPQSNQGFKVAPSDGNVHAFPGSFASAALAPQAPAPAPQKSRSGRTVKSAFNDDIYVESHLPKDNPNRPFLGQYQKPAAVGPMNVGGRQAPTFLQQSLNASMPKPALSQVGNATANMPGAVPMPQGVDGPGAARVGVPGSASLAAAMRPAATYTPAGMSSTQASLPVPPAVLAYPSSAAHAPPPAGSASKGPRRKPGARECMQISRRFGVKVVPQNYMDILFDYCSRGKVEHLIRMRERLDDHSRMLESQLAGLEALVKEKGELDITVPAAEQAAEQSPPK